MPIPTTHPADATTRTDGLPDTIRIHRQRFTVAFDYAVVFTRDAFDPANGALAAAMGAAMGAATEAAIQDGTPRPRCVAFVDLGGAVRPSRPARRDLRPFRRARRPAHAGARAGRTAGGARR